MDIGKRIDSCYGKKISLKLLDFKSNNEGFRLAGSVVENEAADWIVEEMKKIGLKDVVKEEFPVDGWIFKEAKGNIISDGKNIMDFEAGVFSGSLGTSKDGLSAPVVYMGEGTAAEYEKQSAEGKIVLVDTNAFLHNWYDVVFKQAQLRGAIAVMAVPLEPNPGTYSDDLITIHELEAKIDIPAISISVSTGNFIKEQLKKAVNVEVKIIADVEINRNAKAHFVMGRILGKNPDRYIILSGHYDAYWEGLQDNASSLGSQLSIAKAILESGYQPESNIIFSMNGAEEFGHMDTLFAWMAGADAMTKMHPEFAGRTMLLLNIETSALKQDMKLGFSAAEVYHEVMGKFCEEFIETSKDKYKKYYLEGVGTGGDDFVFSTAGIPTALHKALDVFTDFTPGGFMSLYHTAKDNIDLFNDEYFHVNNTIFYELILMFDKMLCAPMNFQYLHEEFWGIIDKKELSALYSKYDEIERELKKFMVKAQKWLDYTKKVNSEFSTETAPLAIKAEAWEISRKQLEAYKKIREEIYKVDIFLCHSQGHYIAYERYKDLQNLIRALAQASNEDSDVKLLQKELEDFLEKGYNHLIDEFDKDVYLTRNVIPFAPNTPKYFAEGKTIEYYDMYDTIKEILRKTSMHDTDFSEEINDLNKAAKREEAVLIKLLDSELNCLKEINNF